MIESIQAIAAGAEAIEATSGPLVPAVTSPSTPRVDFSKAIVAAIGDVETQHTHADSALEQLASGENVDLHGTMIEIEKADIALRTMVSVRDRFISAYEQVMNMTV